MGNESERLLVMIVRLLAQAGYTKVKGVDSD
jgi:hypothetical protein